MKHTLLMSVVVLGLVGFAQNASACTVEEGAAMSNKLMQSEEYANFMAENSGTAEGAQKVGAFTTRLAEAATLLSNGDLEAGCAAYTELFNELGIDAGIEAEVEAIEEEAETMHEDGHDAH